MRFIDFLLQNYELIRPSDIKSLSSVCLHSDKVKDSSLFIAMDGQKSEGHHYIKQAIKKGAKALLVEKTDCVPSDFQGLVLKYNKDHLKLSHLLNEFYDFPSQKLFVVGVTGTNGKTSFCYMLEHIFKQCGWPTAVIGTVDQHFEKHNWPAVLTTPDPAEIFGRMQDFINLGAKALVMEVSSIALDQKRVEGIDFKAMVFTNLSQDHLDYHKDMESYFQTKAKLFSSDLELQNLNKERATNFNQEKSNFQNQSEESQDSKELEIKSQNLARSILKEQISHWKRSNSFCLINQDDEYGRRLKSLAKKPCYTYGKDSVSDFSFNIKKSSSSYNVFELKRSSDVYEVLLPLAGGYNVYNAVSAIATAVLTGFKLEDCVRAIKDFKGIPGRLEKISPQELKFDIFVDYAHTSSALACALSALKSPSEASSEILEDSSLSKKTSSSEVSHVPSKASPNKIILVVGCGGDRDKNKRSEMAYSALKFADHIFWTTDNPRFEDPDQIVKDCLQNISSQGRKKITVELDRKKAIQKALQFAKAGDIVLIAGKGHEQVQIVKDKRLPFCDKTVALQVLKELNLV